ncbi:MAG TPA: hypothetical protein VIY48_08430 [Candidatus Paceibacterota bacterium]
MMKSMSKESKRMERAQARTASPDKNNYEEQTPTSAVDISMDTLAQALSELDVGISTLVRRLDPVSLYKETAGVNEKASLKAVASPLRSRVDDEIERVYELVHVVRATIERLEI